VVAGGGDGAAMISANPERVLPVVIGEMLPTGVRGLVLAGLVAAALSTFDSTLNAGASYVVRDIYQTYLRPEASQKQLIVVSRWATVGLCVAGIGLTALVPNIDTIWGIVTMGIGAGLFVPLVLRWYWPRYNGYGFDAGTAGGLFAGLLTNAVLGWPVIVSFPVIIGTALFASVVGSLITAPTPHAVLLRFARQINPWGFWGRYNHKLESDGLITTEEAARRSSEKFSDMLAIVFSLPFQIGLLITAMSFVFRDWPTFSLFLSITVMSAVALYFLWYRNLRSEAECAAVEAELDAEEAAAGGEAGPRA
jgi:solute:Na+ symporter, SSS family